MATGQAAAWAWTFPIDIGNDGRDDLCYTPELGQNWR